MMSMSFLRKSIKFVFVTINIIVATALIISCYGSKISVRENWFFSVFSLIAIYLLLLTIGLMVFWIFVKPKFSLIGLVAVVVCWNPIQHIFQFRLNNDFSIKKNGRAIRVMSWNVEHFNMLQYKTHPEKKTQMIAFINELQPDIACFQEMVAGDDKRKCINSVEEFQRKLKFDNFYYVYDTAFDFDFLHHFGIITYSKYPIINKQTVIAEPNEYNSIFQYIDVVKNTDTFRVFNIHLQSLRFTTDNRNYIDNLGITGSEDIIESKNILIKYRNGMQKRHLQSDFIRKTIDESPYPVILCGDFNDVPNSYAYNKIGEHLNNAFTSLGSGISNTYDGLSPTLRIDNIFTDKRFEILQYNRFVKKLSDHFPIAADFIYKKEQE